MRRSGHMAAEATSGSLVQGTLHMLILNTLALEPLHGYGIGVRLEQISRGVFKVNAGSLFPALRRLERDGLVRGDWRVTENNRRARYYTLTARGRTTLRRETEEWKAQATAIARILEASPRRP
jgi:transcriptional regulator